MRPVLIVLSIVSAALLSACIDDPVEPTATTPAAEDAATIKGAVVSDEVFPVAGANVSIEGGTASTLSGADGTFSFPDLEPGRYRLNASAEGYAPASQEVSVGAGEVVEIVITVAAIAGDAPYKSTIIFEGFAACTISAVYTAGPFPPAVDAPCPFGDRVTGTSVNVSEGWAAGVHEITWGTQEEMIFSSSLADSCQTSGDAAGNDPCPYLGWGLPPIQVFARPNDADYAAKYAIDGKAMWPEEAHESFVFSSYSGYARTEINQTAYPVCVEINRQFNVPEHWGCPFGVGYSTGLRFSIYHTTFYHQEPLDLEAFTAIPDE